MTITTKSSKDFDVQILNETVQGRFKQRTAFMGSILASQGAVVVNGTFEDGKPNKIGTQVTVPYFGTLGEFADNADGSSVTPSALLQTSETAVVARKSLAFEISRWAQGASPDDRDPYEEAADQILVSAERAMDAAVIVAAETSPLVSDHYSATVPKYLDWDIVTDGRALFGDEQDGIVGMIVHSRTESDLRKLRDSDGRPLLLDSQKDGELTRFCGVPLVVSDRAPLTGSTMNPLVMTETGTTPPDLTLTGTPLGPWNLKIIVGSVTGARGTATFKFSTDGGNTYSAELLTAASVDLIDTAADSLVGVNGKTGLTVAMENASFSANNVYTSTARLKVSSLLVQKGALAFWYNRNALAMETDKDILAHTDIGAMHLYHVAHLYRRRRMGSRPGVVRLIHNVRSYTG